MASFTLDSGAERNRESPDTFWIPPIEARNSLKVGDLAKLIFRIEFGEEAHVERMWVIVTKVKPEFYVGILDNDPYCTDEIQSSMEVQFHADHVIQIDRAKTEQ